MKKSSLFILCLLMTTTVLQARSRNQTITSDASVLPTVSRNFIAKHFNGVGISHIAIERNLLGIKEYNVILTNGIDIEFDKSGEWQEIDGNRASVPDSTVPAYILKYVQENFKESKIVKIDKDWNDYEVDLSNGLELTFDFKGNLLEIDD